MFIKVEGKHPQTGAHVDAWTCAIKEVPTFLMYLGAAIGRMDGELSAFRSEERQANEQAAQRQNQQNGLLALIGGAAQAFEEAASQAGINAREGRNALAHNGEGKETCSDNTP